MGDATYSSYEDYVRRWTSGTLSLADPRMRRMRDGRQFTSSAPSPKHTDLRHTVHHSAVSALGDMLKASGLPVHEIWAVGTIGEPKLRVRVRIASPRGRWVKRRFDISVPAGIAAAATADDVTDLYLRVLPDLDARVQALRKETT